MDGALPYIIEALEDVRNTVDTYSADFNLSESKRTGRAKAIINWVSDRCEYLNELWG